MGTIDLTGITDSLVIHYGGETGTIDAMTFTQSLLNLSKAIQEVNSILNPDYSISIVIEDIGGGSFRCKISSKLGQKIKDLFGSYITKQNAIPIFIAILALLKSSDVTIVQKEGVTIVKGDDTEVVTTQPIKKQTLVKIRNSQIIRNYITNHYHVLNGDPAISGFGITCQLDDKGLLYNVPKDKFKELSDSELTEDEKNKKSNRIYDAILVIVKPAYIGNSRWTVKYKTNIDVDISDTRFLSDFQNNIKPAPPGSKLIADMLETLHYSDKGDYIKSTWEITEVKRVLDKDEQLDF